MTITLDVDANLHRLYYYYKNRGTVSHSRPPQRRSGAGSSSGGPQQPVQNNQQHNPRKPIGCLKAIVLIVCLLLLFTGIAWGVWWKPVDDTLQNYPVIGNKLIVQVQVKQPDAVTKPASIMVAYVNADNNAYSSTYYLDGDTFLLKGEILRLPEVPARFRLVGVMVASNNINSPRSDSEGYNDSALSSSFLLTITHCSVPIGPIKDTQMHTFTIMVLPDGTSENSCSLQKS